MFLKELELDNVDTKTQVNQNSTTGIFLFFWFLDETQDHAVWYYSITASITIGEKHEC